MASTDKASYQFQRGEPIQIGRAVLSGDPDGLDVYAVLKRAIFGLVPSESVAVAATFNTEFVAASGDTAAHWLFWLTASEADALPPGTYATDVRFSIDGEVVAITDPAWIVINESVSG